MQSHFARTKGRPQVRSPKLHSNLLVPVYLSAMHKVLCSWRDSSRQSYSSLETASGTFLCRSLGTSSLLKLTCFHSCNSSMTCTDFCTKGPTIYNAPVRSDIDAAGPCSVFPCPKPSTLNPSDARARARVRAESLRAFLPTIFASKLERILRPGKKPGSPEALRSPRRVF